MKTELVFILDRSGSMRGLEKDTIGGFNAMIDKQKTDGEEVFVTTVLFDHEVEKLHERVAIQKVEALTEKEYYVRGCTALIDAIGSSIDGMIRWQKRLSTADKADKVIFVITTDGYENASKKYSASEVKQMISYQKEKYDWEFLFLGANIDAVAEAKKFGIEEDRAVTFLNDSQGVRLNYEVVSETILEMKECPTSRVDNSWKKKIERDFLKRKK
ncbi:MAG: VWA domain-containing protein [Firmicutes bacterium]|nr:VWA domain-containing protein [Bacillota bacterium]